MIYNQKPESSVFSAVSFRGKDDAKYTWKCNLPRFEFEVSGSSHSCALVEKASDIDWFVKLYSSVEIRDEKFGGPIAQFSKSVKWAQRPATLTLDTRAQDIQNLVVISFLMLEKDNRMKGREIP